MEGSEKQSQKEPQKEPQKESKKFSQKEFKETRENRESKPEIARIQRLYTPTNINTKKKSVSRPISSTENGTSSKSSNTSRTSNNTQLNKHTKEGKLLKQREKPAYYTQDHSDSGIENKRNKSAVVTSSGWELARENPHNKNKKSSGSAYLPRSTILKGRGGAKKEKYIYINRVIGEMNIGYHVISECTKTGENNKDNINSTEESKEFRENKSMLVNTSTDTTSCSKLKYEDIKAALDGNVEYFQKLQKNGVTTVEKKRILNSIDDYSRVSFFYAVYESIYIYIC